jgi:hypothetical protein
VIKFSLGILLKFSAVLTSENILIEKVISTLSFDVGATQCCKLNEVAFWQFSPRLENNSSGSFLLNKF